MGGKRVPKILEERLLIDEKDESLLKIMSNLAPHNSGRFLVTTSIMDNYVPSLSQISKKADMSEHEILERMEKISEVWNLPSPENLPTNLGFYSREESLVNALVNQHRLRWDEKRENYRVTQKHWISGEMGAGTVFTNTDAFLGEKIVRDAMGVDDKLVSYHMQGGVMPDIVTLFGKAKNKRAIMTGMNKATDGIDEEEFDLIVQKLNLLNKELERPSLSAKSLKNLEKYVVNTVNSMEEAAESAGYELSDLVKNLDPNAELHLYWSYNDMYNMSEIEDKNISLLRKIHQKMKQAADKIPELEEEIETLSEKSISDKIDYQITNQYYDFLMKKRENEKEEFHESNSGFGDYRKEFFETVKGSRRSRLNKSLRNKLREEAKEKLGRELETFDAAFEDVWNRFYDRETSMKKVSEHREKVNSRLDKTERRLEKKKKDLQELRNFENSRLVEEMEGHAWFTKKIAITPTEAKALETVKKEIYKGIYEDILIPSLKKHSKRDDLKIYLHTDDMMSVEIPDPQDTIEGKKDDPLRPIGTIFTSIPRTNSQWSNEPLKKSFDKLQRLHEGEISNSIASGKKRPEIKKEFNKRDLAHSDHVFSSWGADGYLSQIKFTVDPTTVQGEYVFNPHMTRYEKVPTRHDLHKMADVMLKGNRGTWAGKRLAKGGTIGGSLLLIDNADGSKGSVFFDDRYFKKVANSEVTLGNGKKVILGEEYNELEQKLLNAKTKKSKEKLEKKKEELLKFAKPEIGYLLLQNDLHEGSYSTPGRPSNIDTITSSQLVALQSRGVRGFEGSFMTEAVHGEMAYRSYDSKREGASNDDFTHLADPFNFMRRLNTLESKMRKEGASKKEILEATQLYAEEFLDGIPAFKPEDQLNIFDSVSVPINTELMENGANLYMGTGNHWMGKSENQSEATVLAGRFNRKYTEQGLLVLGQGTAGQSYSIDYVKLPSSDGKGIEAVLTHKMWHGGTEVSEISNQLVKARAEGVYAITADRHHQGEGAEKGKMFVLDAGKQSTIPYAKMIGKCASTNGTMIMGYGKGRELILATNAYLNNTIDRVSGWEHKAGILKKVRGLVKEAMNDESLARDFRNQRYLLDKAEKRMK